MYGRERERVVGMGEVVAGVDGLRWQWRSSQQRPSDGEGRDGEVRGRRGRKKGKTVGAGEGRGGGL